MSDTIRETLGRIDERSARTEASVTRVEHAIFGNGKPGLLRKFDDAERRIAHIEQSQADARKREDKSRAARSRFVWGIVAALTIAVATDVYKLVVVSATRDSDSQHSEPDHTGGG